MHLGFATYEAPRDIFDTRAGLKQTPLEHRVDILGSSFFLVSPDEPTRFQQT